MRRTVAAICAVQTAATWGRCWTAGSRKQEIVLQHMFSALCRLLPLGYAAGLPECGAAGGRRQAGGQLLAGEHWACHEGEGAVLRQVHGVR